MQAEVAELVAKARELDIDRMSEIVGQKVETISVGQVYFDTVVVEVHLGERLPSSDGSTFPLLKYLSEQLDTERLDLHDKWFSDEGWEIWCRP